MLLGFDIGGTKCAVLLGMSLGDSLKVIERRAFPTNLPVFEMLEFLYQEAESILVRHDVLTQDLAGIGISCGGPLSSKKGLILSPPNLPGWDRIPIVKMTEERFKVRVKLQNDANACAVAEWKYGAGRGYNNLIFLTFGTGMGAGLILNGALYSGISDLAGEVGHLRIGDLSGPVGFGKAGSFEGYCSGGGIAQLGQMKAREQLQMGRTVAYCQNLDQIPMISAKLVAEAAFQGDSTALEVYQICGEQLGRVLAWFVDIFNPELILLGSIYSRAKDLLDPAMHRVMAKEALAESLADCRVLPAGLGEEIGDFAALTMAALSNFRER